MRTRHFHFAENRTLSFCLDRSSFLEVFQALIESELIQDQIYCHLTCSFLMQRKVVQWFQEKLNDKES